MKIDAKIREAFEKHFPATHNSNCITESEKFFFREGYMALLNELEFGGEVGSKGRDVFYLPKRDEMP